MFTWHLIQYKLALDHVTLIDVLICVNWDELIVIWDELIVSWDYVVSVNGIKLL